MSEYCIYCFKDGDFTGDITMEDMINISLKHMRELFKGDPDFNEQAALIKMRDFFPELKSTGHRTKRICVGRLKML